VTDRLLQKFAERATLDHVLSPAALDLALQELPQQLHGQVLLRHPPHLGQELLGEDRDLGLLQARGREEVHHALGRDGAGDDLADGVVEIFFGSLLARGPLAERRPRRLEEGHVVADGERPFVRHRQRERA
jgi:hypothetical protein